MVREINEQEFNENVMNEEGTKVVDFSATWCGPCKMLSPVYEQIAEEMEDKAEFYKVDIDKSMALARKYNITTVPTVVVIKEGIEEERLIGFIPKEQLEEKIAAHI